MVLGYVRAALSNGHAGDPATGPVTELHVGRPLSSTARRQLAEAAASPGSLPDVHLSITDFDPEVRPGERAMPGELEAVRRDGATLRATFTVRPSNCLVADDVLEWCEGAAIRDVTFHAGTEFLTRRDGEVAGVTHTTRFHTAMFFERLSRVRTFDWGRRTYYRRLAGLIEAGAARDHASVGPAGPSVRDLADVAARVASAKVQQMWPKRQATLERGPYRPASRPTPSSWRHVLITGWYGTETHGDKAILGELLEFLHRHAPDCRITLSTIHPRISRQTEHELSRLAGTKLVAIERSAAPSLIESVDAVIMGGGPLMESASMNDIWRIFREANRQGKARVIFGCGLGPIHSSEVRELTSAILGVTTAGFLRDQESHALASELCPDHVLKVACDPAVAFVDRWRRTRQPAERGSGSGIRIAGLVRANTTEFDVSDSAVVGAANERTAQQIAEIVAPVCAETGAEFELLHMNAHWVGGDDRLMNRQIERAFGGRPGLVMRREYLPLDAHMSRLASADVSLAMRYHGHVFSLALGVPFLSIDYTGPSGKVGSLLRRIGYEGQSQPWGQLDLSRGRIALTALLAERDAWSAHLLAQTQRLVGDFEATCREVFDLDEKGVGVR